MLPNEVNESGGGKGPKSWISFRLGFVYICFVVYFSFVAFRLVQLQVLENPDLAALAQRQYRRVEKKFPYRLPVYDRNQEELAISTPASSVFVRPKLVRNRREAARTFAKYLGGSQEKWMQKLKTKKGFVWIQRQVNADIAKKIASHKVKGIFVEPENRRIYPNGPLAASVLGFTDIDGNGLAGIERALNDHLLNRGEPVQVARDGKGNPSYIDKEYVTRTESHRGVYLTLDRRVQHALEEELDVAIESTQAKSAMAIVMDPYTGEIYAMGQRPSFDPNQPGQYSPQLLSNWVVSHLYEPGSTMKVLFASEAIQNGLMNRNTLVDCGNGKLVIGKKTITEAESNHVFSVLPLEKVISYSSNIGAVRVAQMLGTDRVRSTLDKFGLTQRTGIGLPGEASSAAKGEEAWGPFFLATVGFGQGISVTPLQMISAFAPFANGGYMVRPKVLLSEILMAESHEVRRVLSPGTVQMVKQMLIAATEGKGATGALAKVPGMLVAGKTGTAQKYEAGSGYESKKYFSSFVGFLPADRPQLLIAAMVDEPKKAYYASTVAAPLFRRIAERSMAILNKNPQPLAAKKDSDDRKRSFIAFPREGLPNELQSAGNDQWILPDLQGLTMRETLKLLGKSLGNVRYLGEGFVESQSPRAGTIVGPDTPIQLKFSGPS